MNLDNILKEVGPFGKYQMINLIFLLFPILFTAYFSISYVFTAGDLEYRCLIPECEPSGNDSFYPKWLNYSIPKKSDGSFEKCRRYQPVDHLFHPSCESNLFYKNTTIRCDKYVFQTHETTIVSDFKLLCEENKWKRTFVGTINNLGQFVGLPIIGYFSDRFGRKTLLIAGTLLSTIMGISRSFSPSYISFLSFEFLDAVVSTGIYSGGFILGVELVGPEKRVLASTILASFYSVGEIILALVMWYLEDWRHSLRVLYTPALFFIFYIWIIPESVRWLMAKGKYKNAVQIIHKMSNVNKKPLSRETIAQLEALYSVEKEIQKFNRKDRSLGGPSQEPNTVNPKGKSSVSGSFPIKEFLKSPRMVLRFINCSFCWITNTFVFYGLSLSSVSVAGNKYVNFMLVSVVEIPGYVLTWLIMDVIGRRPSQFIFLAVSGGSCIAFYFIPEDYTNIRLGVFLCGKMAITASFTVLYVFSTEMFPTNARHSLLGSCSMFGRIGSMIAPQTPLIADYVNPLLLFGGISLTSGSLALLFPETLNTRLPDNIQEAIKIGKKSQNEDVII